MRCGGRHPRNVAGEAVHCSTVPLFHLFRGTLLICALGSCPQVRSRRLGASAARRSVLMKAAELKRGIETNGEEIERAYGNVGREKGGR